MATVLAFLTGASLAGCIIDPLRSSVTVHNQTDVELAITHDGEHLRTVPAGASRDLVIGRGDECQEWELEASTPDGAVFAIRDAPVCNEDEWTISESAASP